MPRLLLINPDNPLVSITRHSYLNSWRVWKPLGLLVIAGLTPSDWDVTIVDENMAAPEYEAMRPDLVGITAFTSQATRAYELAALWRARGVPVVMGGIHASLCCEEAMSRVDAVVTGEAESVWAQVCEDAKSGKLAKLYRGEFVDTDKLQPARHDLLANQYRFGSIQTTRGCPLNCSFCSVTAFNGGRYRQRPIDAVVEELRLIREDFVLFVDDNLFGTRKEHIERSKSLLRAIIKAGIRKRWICQTTVNMADDPELLDLAVQSGCFGVFIGFEATTPEGLIEVHKKFNTIRNRDLRDSVMTIQRHGIAVIGAFVIGLDVDTKGIGTMVAETADRYGVAAINVLILTPLPGTDLWKKLDAEGRILKKDFPNDWQYYTLNHPVATFKNHSWRDLVEEMVACYRRFYSWPSIFARALQIGWRTRRIVPALGVLVVNASYRLNLRNDLDTYARMDLDTGASLETLGAGTVAVPQAWKAIAPPRRSAKALPSP
jgi:radical SAM superfamily enzyme YgiQ (UPF0313 family)